MKYTNILKVSILLLICGTLFSSCSKYDQGPGLSFRSKSARVTNHWKVQKVLWEGDDVTELLEGQTYEFKEDNTYAIYDNDIVSENGKWSLVEEKEKLEMIDNEYPDEKITYTIIKLKEKEMMWEYTEDDETFEFTFIPK